MASLAPNAGDGAENPPKAGAAAGAAWAAGVPPKAKGAFATGVAGAPKLNVDADVGGVGVATDPKPPKAGAGDAADAPKEVDAGGAPKPVAAGDGAPKLGAVAPKLNDVDGAADGAVDLVAPRRTGEGGVALVGPVEGKRAGLAHRRHQRHQCRSSTAPHRDPALHTGQRPPQRGDDVARRSG